MDEAAKREELKLLKSIIGKSENKNESSGSDKSPLKKAIDKQVSLPIVVF